jgi:hypothetical protein
MSMRSKAAAIKNFVKGIIPSPPPGGKITRQANRGEYFRDSKTVRVTYSYVVEYQGIDRNSPELRKLWVQLQRQGIDLPHLDGYDLKPPEKWGEDEPESLIGQPGRQRGSDAQYASEISKARAFMTKVPKVDESTPDFQKVVDVTASRGWITLRVPRIGSVEVHYKDVATLVINGLRRKGYKVNKRADNQVAEYGWGKPYRPKHS